MPADRATESHNDWTTTKGSPQYNTRQKIEWLTWDLPARLRDRIADYATRLHEAQRRDSQFDAGMVLYFAGWEGADELPEYNPDNPHHANLPFGHILSEPNVVHVLRPGVELEDDPDADADEYMPPHYDFSAFFELAERLREEKGWACDLGFSRHCANRYQHAAIPKGRDIYMVSICHACLAELDREFKETHPGWRMPQGWQPNIMHAAVKRPPPSFGAR
ncbi:hypothetical protein [Mycolicibacterium sp.]|uniref:hypothetical protein n=1 Tax=Mycolicibacterium sp. TaxID=2320850 RepID=UPI003D1298A4